MSNGPKICGRCYCEVDTLYLPNCNERPEKLVGVPLGQYHCPDCGAMVLAGIEHPCLCERCFNRTHPSFDLPAPKECLYGSAPLPVGYFACPQCNKNDQVVDLEEGVSGTDELGRLQEADHFACNRCGIDFWC